MNYIESLREELIKALAKSEAYIDFNEDEVSNFFKYESLMSSKLCLMTRKYG